MIIVEPTSGLCSRIFVICDAYDLAKHYNQKLIILWTQTADCNCNYYDVFDQTQFSDIDCKVIQFSRYGRELKDAGSFRSIRGIALFAGELCRRVWFGCKYYPTRLFYKSRCTVYKNAYTDGNAALNPEMIKDCNSFIEAYNGIHHKHDVSAARFSERTLQEVDKVLKVARGNCVGVHIRRTDHEPAKGSLTDNFIQKMHVLLQEDATLYFYLATDDWTEQERLIAEFGDHIIVQKEKALTRSTKQGMHSSVIDFLCLSKTKFILGSYSSMFSELSAKLGGVELVII